MSFAYEIIVYIDIPTTFSWQPFRSCKFKTVCIPILVNRYTYHSEGFLIAFTDNHLSDLIELAWNQNFLKMFANSSPLPIDV